MEEIENLLWPTPKKHGGKNLQKHRTRKVADRLFK